MIDGVKIKKLVIHGHDRGNFCELLRNDEDLLVQFGQIAISETYPGIIKAFHWHKRQDDIWYIIKGNAQVVLYDLRKDSSTYKETQVVYLGEMYAPQVLVIPKGVAHGFRVLGNDPVLMMYVMTESYDPKNLDEFRIPFDDPEIGFNWETKNV